MSHKKDLIETIAAMFKTTKKRIIITILVFLGIWTTVLVLTLMGVFK